MKNKITLIVIGAAIGLGSFFLGMLWKENEISFYFSHNSVISDSFRVAQFYDVLKKYDEGRKKEAIDSLRSWMETDIMIINTYRDKLSGDERKRIDGLLKAVEPYRGISNHEN